MSEMEYTYAVARIRALEVSLFNTSTIDQLMACKSYKEALNFIIDKGWGSVDTPPRADEILAAEQNKIWDVIRELRVSMDTFDVLSLPNAFHNLKTAVKEAYTQTEHDDFYYESTAPSREELRDIIAKKEYYRLPASMEKPAQDALETMLHTGDGQLCDVIIDRACLMAILEAGKKSGQKIIEDYARTVVATSNIKIAVRCQKTGKPMDFILRALAPGEELDAERLAKAALSGFEAICDYLANSGYADAVEALKISPSAFERWCDNALIEMIRPQKYNAFSVGPLVAYVLARENEIKTVGIILSGKQNGLSDDSIRERIREMYV